MIEYKRFVLRLKELMAERGVTANKLSVILNVNHKTVDGWLSYGFFPRIDNLVKLSEFFNCSIDYLLGLSDDDALHEELFDIAFNGRYNYLYEKNKCNGRQIAKICDVEPSTVSKWHYRKTIPDTLSLIRLANFFACTLEYLLGRIN